MWFEFVLSSTPTRNNKLSNRLDQRDRTEQWTVDHGWVQIVLSAAHKLVNIEKWPGIGS